MNNLYKILLILAGLGIFISCDKIDGPYITEDSTVATTVIFPDLDTNAVYRKILLEEFTGCQCVNCPQGHLEMANLLAVNGDTLVGLCIHAGFFARPLADYPRDFRTNEGTQLYDDLQAATIGTPCGEVNRNTNAQAIAQWQSSIQNVDRTQRIAAIQLINQYDAGTRILTANTKTTILHEYSNPVKLALYVVEDGIVYPQKNGTEIDTAYVHNHMLRGSLNGTYGANISENGYVDKGVSYTKSYQVNCGEKDWNVDNCVILAILTDAVTKEVLQVEKCSFLDD